MAPITIIPKACSCCKGARSSRDKSSNLPLPNILYEGSEGSEGKVDGPSDRGLWPPVGGGLYRRGRRPFGPRVVDCPSGNAYKVSVTGLAFYVIWHDRHYDDWLAALASPYPAAPDFSTGKRVTRFSGRFASLRIVFPCHPYAGGRIGFYAFLQRHGSMAKYP